MCGNNLKCILMYLNNCKYSEIDMRHSDLQKHTLHKKWYNSLSHTKAFKYSIDYGWKWLEAYFHLRYTFFLYFAKL